MVPATSRRREKTETTKVPERRSVVLAVAMSLDGYIARKSGAVDWLVEDPEINLSDYARKFDVIVAGRKTLDMPDEHQEGRSPWGKMDCYIFSRSKPPGKRGGVQYVNQTPTELLRTIREQPGKDIWLMGGGELAREFLKEDLVDGMDLAVMPVLLGEGVPLFPEGFPQRCFSLEKFQAYGSGIVRMSYLRTTEVGRAKN